MKIKTIRICLLLLVALFAALLLVSCNKVVVVTGVHMKDDTVYEMVAGEFSYDGKILVVEYANGEKNEVALTEAMIPEAERLKFFKMGEQEVKVVYGDRFVTSFKIKVERHKFEDIYELVGYTCTYDGNPHRVEFNNELPEGAVADFIYGNTFTNAGTYNVVAVITKEGYVSKTLSTELVIEKATYDTSELIFEDKTVTYDSEAKTIEAENVPEGVNVRYDTYIGNIRITNAVNSGTYRVIAHFDNTNSNYNNVPDKQATLTIQKANYDMSQVYLNNVVKTYDGNNYIPSLGSESVLPSGVSVSFECKDKDGNVVTSNANAGEYDIVAHFASNSANHNSIPDMNAKLVVQKRTIEFLDDIIFDDKTYNYDRQQHSLTVVGALPEGVNLTYENNDQIDVGVYEVIAKFEATNPNEDVDVDELTSYLTINSITESVLINGHRISEADLRYDVTNYTISLLGLDTDVYYLKDISFYYVDGNGQQVKIEWGNEDYKLEDRKAYTFSISFGFVDERDDKNVSLLPSTGTFTHTDIIFESKVVDYDSTPHTIEAQGVPSYYDTSYSYYYNGELVTEAVNAGEYEVVLHVIDGDSLVLNKTAYLVINKITIDVSNVEFDDGEATYDGTAKTIAVNPDTLPSGVYVTYEYMHNGIAVDSAINAGTYTVYAYFAPIDSINYETNTVMFAKLVIKKRIIHVEGISMEDVVCTYDWEPHSIYITGTLPEGAEVAYDGNGQTDWGTYHIFAYINATDPKNNEVDVSLVEAVLTINKFQFTAEGIRFGDYLHVQKVKFNTYNQSMYISGNLPAGVSVSYEGNNQRNVGEYPVTAYFSSHNDNIEIVTDKIDGTLKIEPKYINVKVNGQSGITNDCVLIKKSLNTFLITGLDLDTTLFKYTVELSYVEKDTYKSVTLEFSPTENLNPDFAFENDNYYLMRLRPTTIDPNEAGNYEYSIIMNFFQYTEGMFDEIP